VVSDDGPLLPDLSDGVHRFEGTVDKFTGDGIMAILGAPIAHEDHARRAGRASANSPYNTAQECEVGKFKALDAEGNGSIFLASKCIASDDPRLKAK
jgi:hypothetical protein